MKIKKTQSEIMAEIEDLIPSTLLEKYPHLSFDEMAEMEAFAEYADDLRQAERDWYFVDEG